MRRAFKNKASGDETYDKLKKACDHMLAKREERWTLQQCMVRDAPPLVDQTPKGSLSGAC